MLLYLKTGTYLPFEIAGRSQIVVGRVDDVGVDIHRAVGGRETRIRGLEVFIDEVRIELQQRRHLGVLPDSPCNKHFATSERDIVYEVRARVEIALAMYGVCFV